MSETNFLASEWKAPHIWSARERVEITVGKKVPGSAEADSVCLQIITQGLAGRIFSFLSSLFGKQIDFDCKARFVSVIKTSLSEKQSESLSQILKDNPKLSIDELEYKLESQINDYARNTFNKISSNYSASRSSSNSSVVDEPKTPTPEEPGLLVPTSPSSETPIEPPSISHSSSSSSAEPVISEEPIAPAVSSSSTSSSSSVEDSFSDDIDIPAEDPPLTHLIALDRLKTAKTAFDALLRTEIETVENQYQPSDTYPGIGLNQWANQKHPWLDKARFALGSVTTSLLTAVLGKSGQQFVEDTAAWGLGYTAKLFSDSIDKMDDEPRDLAILERLHSPTTQIANELAQMSSAFTEGVEGYEEFTSLQTRVEDTKQSLDALQTYFEACDALDVTMEHCADQRETFFQGKIDLSPENYVAMANEVQRFSELQETAKNTLDPQWQQRIERKCHLQTIQAITYLNDFVDDLAEEMQAELIEAKTQLRYLQASIIEGTAKKKPFDLSELTSLYEAYCRYQGVHTNSLNLIAEIKRLSKEPSLSPEMQAAHKKDAQLLQSKFQPIDKSFPDSNDKLKKTLSILLQRLQKWIPPKEVLWKQLDAHELQLAKSSSTTNQEVIDKQLQHYASTIYLGELASQLSENHVKYKEDVKKLECLDAIKFTGEEAKRRALEKGYTYAVDKGKDPVMYILVRMQAKKALPNLWESLKNANDPKQKLLEYVDSLLSLEKAQAEPTLQLFIHCAEFAAESPSVTAEQLETQKNALIKPELIEALKSAAQRAQKYCDDQGLTLPVLNDADRERIKSELPSLLQSLDSHDDPQKAFLTSLDAYEAELNEKMTIFNQPEFDKRLERCYAALIFAGRLAPEVVKDVANVDPEKNARIKAELTKALQTMAAEAAFRKNQKGLSHTIEELYDNVFRDSPALSDDKKKVQEMHKLCLDKTPAGKTKWFYVFAWLQLWDKFSPLAGLVIGTVGQRDYNFHLAMMRQTAKTDPEQYAYHLKMAQGFKIDDWLFGSDGFLDNYDQYLRGDVEYYLEKIPLHGSLGGTHAFTPPETNADIDAAPTSWWQAFLGNDPDQAAMRDKSDWEKWLHYTIYPQVRDNHFDAISKFFDSQEIAPPSASSTREELFTYHCYKMHQSLQTFEGQSDYARHLLEAKAISQYNSVLKEYHRYLQDRASALQTPLPDIAVTTVPIGQQVVSKLQDEVEAMSAYLSRVDEKIGEASPLQAQHRLVEQYKQTASELKAHTPFEYADKAVIDDWLKKVQSLNENFENTRLELRKDALSIEWKDLISAKQLEMFVQTPANNISTDLLRSIFNLRGTDENLFKTLAYQLDIIQTRIEVIRSDAICTQEKAAEFCAEYFENPIFAATLKDTTFLESMQQKIKQASSLSKTLAENPEKFSGQLNGVVAALEVGESTFFHGPEGTAVHEITKQANGRFTLGNFITDRDAQQKHAHLFAGTKHRTSPYLETTDVPLSTLLSDELQEIIKKPWTTPPIDKLEYFLATLKGLFNSKNLSTPQDRYVDELPSTPYQLLQSMFLRSLDDQESQRFRFESEFKALVDFHHLNSHLYIHPETYQLVDQTTTDFLVQIQKWHTQHVVNDNELDYVLEKMRAIKTTLADLKVTHAQALQHNAALPNLEKLSGQALAITDLELDIPYVNAGDAKTQQVRNLSYEAPFSFPASSETTFPQLLENLTAYSKAANANGQYENNIASFHRFVEYISKNFNQKVLADGEDLYQVVNAINELSNQFHLSLLTRANDPYHPLNSKITATDYLALISLLGRVDVFVKSQLDSTFQGLPIPLYMPAFTAIFDGKDPQLQAPTPEWAERLKELKRIWVTTEPAKKSWEANSATAWPQPEQLKIWKEEFPDFDETQPRASIFIPSNPETTPYPHTEGDWITIQQQRMQADAAAYKDVYLPALTAFVDACRDFLNIPEQVDEEWLESNKEWLQPLYHQFLLTDGTFTLRKADDRPNAPKGSFIEKEISVQAGPIKKPISPILPLLRQLSIRSYLTLNNVVPEEMSQELFDKGIAYNAALLIASDGSFTEISEKHGLHVFGKKWEWPAKDPVTGAAIADIDKQNIFKEKTSLDRYFSSPEHTLTLGLIDTNTPVKKPVAPQDVLAETVRHIDAGDKRPIKLIRQLVGLNTFKELQAFATIDFYTKNQYLLSDPEHQKLLTELLLDPEVMQKALQSSPENNELFVNTLASFLNEAITFYTKNVPNPAVASFLLNLNLQIDAAIKSHIEVETIKREKKAAALHSLSTPAFFALYPEERKTLERLLQSHGFDVQTIAELIDMHETEVKQIEARMRQYQSEITRYEGIINDPETHPRSQAAAQAQVKSLKADFAAYEQLHHSVNSPFLKDENGLKALLEKNGYLILMEGSDFNFVRPTNLAIQTIKQGPVIYGDKTFAMKTLNDIFSTYKKNVIAQRGVFTKKYRSPSDVKDTERNPHKHSFIPPFDYDRRWFQTELEASLEKASTKEKSLIIEEKPLTVEIRSLLEPSPEVFSSVERLKELRSNLRGAFVLSTLLSSPVTNLVDNFSKERALLETLINTQIINIQNQLKQETPRFALSIQPLIARLREILLATVDPRKMLAESEQLDVEPPMARIREMLRQDESLEVFANQYLKITDQISSRIERHSSRSANFEMITPEIVSLVAKLFELESNIKSGAEKKYFAEGFYDSKVIDEKKSKSLEILIRVQRENIQDRLEQESPRIASFIKPILKEKQDIILKALLDTFLSLNKRLSMTKFVSTYLEMNEEIFDAIKQYEQRSNNKLKPEVITLLHSRLALSYAAQKELSTDEAVELIYAVIAAHRHELPTKLFSKSEKVQLHNLLHDKQEQIKSLLAEEPEKILNGIYQRLSQSATPLEWKKEPETFPIFESSNGRVKIDVLNGQMHEEAGDIDYLAEKIPTHPLFIAFFGDTVVALTRQADNGSVQGREVYQATTKEGHTYRFIAEGDDLFIQRQHDEKWYQLAHDEEEIASIQATLPVAIQTGFDYWHYQDKILLSNKTEKSANYLISHGAAGTKGPGEKIWVIENEQTTGFILADPASCPLTKILARIADPEKDMLMYQEAKSGLIHHVKLPKLGLSFDIKEKNGVWSAISPELDNCELAQKQHIQTLSSFSDYLVLSKQTKTGDDKKIAVVPLNLPSETEQPSKGYIVYDVGLKKDSLTPKTDSAALFLSRKYLENKNYKEAFKLLKKYEWAKALDADSVNILKSFAAFNQDEHPLALAVRLKATVLLIRQQRDFANPDIQIDGDELLEDYNLYLEMARKDEEVHLNRNDQLFILEECRQLIDSTALPQQRIVLKREQELGKVLTEEQQYMLGTATTIEAKVPGKPISFSAVNARKLFPLLTEEFVSLYDALRKKDDLVTTYDLIRSAKPFITDQKDLFNKENVLEALNKNLLEHLSQDVEEKALESLLLKAVIDHPEAFPENLTILETFTTSESKKIWLKDNVISALRTVMLSDEALQTYIYGVPEHSILAAPKIFEAPLLTEFQKPLPLERASVFHDLPIVTLPMLSIREVPPSQETIEKINQRKKELDQLLGQKVQNNIAAKNLAALQEQINKLYDDTKEPFKSTYEIIDQQQFQKAQDKLRSRSHELEKELLTMKDAIEALANKPSADAAKQNIHNLRLLAGQTSPLSIDECILSLLHPTAEQIHQRNPNLTIEEIKLLRKQTQDFSLLITEKHLLDTILDLSLNEGTLQKMGDLVKRLRAYESGQRPELLIFEDTSGYRIKDEQLDVIDALRNTDINAPDLLVEFQPGAGKTSTVAPLLSYYNADGQQLAIIVIPKELGPSMEGPYEKKIKDAFDQVLQSINFDRDSPSEASDLAHLLQNFEIAIKDRHAVFMSKESLAAMYLKFAEILSGYIDAKAADPNTLLPEKSIEYCQRIFTLLKEANVVFDEVHDTLSVRKSTQFTMDKARKLIDVNPVIGSTIIDFYKFIQKNPALLIVEEDFPEYDLTKPPPLFEASYHRVTKPRLVQAIIDGKIETTSGGFERFLSSLSPDEKEKIRAFLNGKMADDTREFTDHINDPKIKDELALLYTLINSLYPQAAQKNRGEHYGFAVLDEEGNLSVLAAPRDQGMPTPIGTQFQSVLEVVTYSLLNHKTTIAMVKKEISELLKEASQELKAKTGATTLEETQAGQKITAFIGKNHGFQLFSLSEEDFEQIAELINQNPDNTFHFFEKYALREIEVYTTQLSADAHSMAMLVGKILGMTGTASNARSLPKMEVTASSTAAITFDLFLKNSPQQVDLVAKPANHTPEAIKTTLNQFFASSHSMTSLLDVGGELSGFSNEDIAKMMYTIFKEKEWTCQGVGFYSSKGKILVVSQDDQENWKIQELAKSGISKNNLAFYWDQARTKGSDIPLGADASAVASFNPYTDKDRVIQGSWRLRDLANNQKVRFAINKETKALVRLTLEKELQKPIATIGRDELLLYSLILEAQQQGVDNFQSFTQELPAILREKCFSVILKASPAEVPGIYQACRPLFETTEVLDIYEQYAKPLLELGKEEAVDIHIKAFLNSSLVKNFLAHPLLGSLWTLEDIKKEAELVKQSKMDDLPNQITMAHQFGRTTQTQTQKQTDTNVQKTTNTNVQKTTNTNIQKTANTNVQVQETDALREAIKVGKPNPIMTWPFENFLGKSYFNRHNVALINTVFSHTPDPEGLFAECAHLFSSNLLCSKNLCSSDGSSWGLGPWLSLEIKSPTFDSPFQVQQNNFNHVLIEKYAGETRVIMIDSNDVLQLRQRIIDDSYTRDQKDTAVAIWDLEKGYFIQKSNSFGEEMSAEQWHVSEVIAQAQFLKGDISYSPAVRQWLRTMSQKDLIKIKQLFEKTILPWSVNTQEEYEKSTLAMTFNELLASKKPVAEMSFINKLGYGVLQFGLAVSLYVQLSIIAKLMGTLYANRK